MNNIPTLFFNYVLRRYGLLSLINTLLLLGALITTIFFAIPEHHRLVVAKKEAVTMERQMVSRHKTDMTNASGAMVNVFYRMLPTDAGVNNQLEKFFDAAFENNVYISSVEYKLEDQALTNFSRFRINLPVSGSYGDIRKFIQKILVSMPNASLDNISLSREDASDADIDSKLQFSLYIKTIHANK